MILPLAFNMLPLVFKILKKCEECVHTIVCRVYRLYTTTSIKYERKMFFHNGRKGVYLQMKKFLGFIKKYKKAIIIIAILAVVAVVAINIVKAVKNAQNLIAGMQSSASTEEIEVRDIVNSVTATGTIVAVDKRTISSTVTGVKIKELNVEVGDQVQAGQILCLLDGENLEAQLADAQKMLNADAGRSNLDVQSSNRGLNEAVEQRDISATRAEEDKKTAYSHVQTAANDCEEAKNKYDNASGKTKSAKDALDAAKSALAQAEAGSAPNVDVINAQMLVVSSDFNSRLTLLKEYVDSIPEKYPDITVNPGDPSEAEIKGEYNYLDAGYSTLLAGINIDTGISNMSVYSIYKGDNQDIISAINEHLNAMKNDSNQYFALAASKNSPVIDASAIAEKTAALQKAQANYDAALAREESMKSAYESTVRSVESMWESYNNVVRAGDDSKRSNESAVASRVDGVKNSQLSSSVATLSDQRNIAQLQEQIDGCVVTASIDGIVTDISVIQGDTYLGGAIVTIENTQDYEVSAQIDEYDIAKIKVGQEVIVKTNGTGLTEMKGEVKSIAPHATNEMGSSGVKYEVIISVLDKNPDLRLDMTAKVEILLEKSESVLSVSTEAIQYDEEENAYVEVLDSGSPVDTSTLLSDPNSVDEKDLEQIQNGEKSYESHKVYVTIGIEGDYYTEISSEELSEGTKIVIPNDGAFSDLEEYMEEAGMIGGF